MSTISIWDTRDTAVNKTKALIYEECTFNLRGAGRGKKRQSIDKKMNKKNISFKINAV